MVDWHGSLGHVIVGDSWLGCRTRHRAAFNSLYSSTSLQFLSHQEINHILVPEERCLHLCQDIMLWTFRGAYYWTYSSNVMQMYWCWRVSELSDLNVPSSLPSKQRQRRYTVVQPKEILPDICAKTCVQCQLTLPRNASFLASVFLLFCVNISKWQWCDCNLY